MGVRSSWAMSAEKAGQARERLLQAVQHLVERPGHRGQLRRQAGHLDAFAQRRGVDALQAGGHFLDGPHAAPGYAGADQRAGDQRRPEHDSQAVPPLGNEFLAALPIHGYLEQVGLMSGRCGAADPGGQAPVGPPAGRLQHPPMRGPPRRPGTAGKTAGGMRADMPGVSVTMRPSACRTRASTGEADWTDGLSSTSCFNSVRSPVSSVAIFHRMSEPNRHSWERRRGGSPVPQ